MYVNIQVPAMQFRASNLPDVSPLNELRSSAKQPPTSERHQTKVHIALVFPGQDDVRVA